VLFARRPKLYYTASGIITPKGGRPVHRNSFALFLAFMPNDGKVRVLKIAVGFLVYNVEFGQTFLQLLSFSPVSNNLPTLQNHISFTTANAI